MTITVLYGTESGNSELIAQDINDRLQQDGHESEVFDLQDFEPESITADNFYIGELVARRQ